MLSTATNLALALLVARVVDPQGFGAFGLSYATYILALGVSRSLACDPLVVALSSDDERGWKDQAAAATAVATAIGVLLGVGCIAASLIVPSPLDQSLLITGLALPGLLLQDAWRHVFFASRKGRSAFYNDLIWFAVMAAIVAMILIAGSGSLLWMMGAWGLSGGLAAIAGIGQSGFAPKPKSAPAWFRASSRMGFSFLGQFGAEAGAIHLSLFAIAGISGLASVASIRGAQLLLGPVNLAWMSLRMVALPELVRMRAQPARIMRWTRGIAAALVGVSCVWGLILVVLPDGIGEALLHATWEGAQSVMPPMIVYMISASLISGAYVGLRSLAQAGRSLRAQILIAPLTVIGGAVGAAIDNAWGAAIGLASASLLGAALYWRELRAAARDPRAIGEVVSSPPR